MKEGMVYLCTGTFYTYVVQKLKGSNIRVINENNNRAVGWIGHVEDGRWKDAGYTITKI